MTRLSTKKILLLVASVVLLTLFLTACDNAEEPTQRLPDRHVFDPGPVFATNINHDDPRRVLRCAVILEVIDELAIEELWAFSDTIRNAILMVLGELTLAEVTTDKDLEDIGLRIVERVNESINSNIPMVIGATFTEFVLT